MSTQTKKEQEEVKAGEAAGDEQQQGAAAPVEETKRNVAEVLAMKHVLRLVLNLMNAVMLIVQMVCL